ncbi:MAG: RraA family protein [Anaerolineae bacterium]
MPTEIEMLEALKESVVATYPKSPLCLRLHNTWTMKCYADATLRCWYPELGRLVGFAVTAVYGLPDANYAKYSMADVTKAMEVADGPTIFIFEQRFPPEIAKKVGLSGGNMTTATQVAGCVGAITNGPSRDIDEIRPMGFQYLTAGVCAGHGDMAIHALQVPVSVAGMDVAPDEIIHMDEKGFSSWVSRVREGVSVDGGKTLRSPRLAIVFSQVISSPTRGHSGT